MLYRRKPGTVEAEQWFPGTPMDEVKEIASGQSCGCMFEGAAHGHMKVGWNRVDPGDYIVTDAVSIKRIIKRDIFEYVYERVVPVAGPLAHYPA